MNWMLLIYTLPSQPSRKRAYVWRALKKLGAVYLRDGVVLLPDRPELRQRLESVAKRIVHEEGTAELALRPDFLGDRDESLVTRFQAERLTEYRALHHTCVRFLRDVLHEVDADDFGFPDVENLEGELGRLKRWYEQIKARDYFQAPGSEKVREILEKCARAFERFSSEASEAGGENRGTNEDVFERLGGRVNHEPVPEEYPL
jgi:hypothetical protein